MWKITVEYPTGKDSWIVNNLIEAISEILFSSANKVSIERFN